MITSRRTFLKTTALSGASLIVGFNCTRICAADVPNEFTPNGWIKIDPAGTVWLTIGKSEMGQGVRTSLAMMLAEELDADWSRIKLTQAKPGPGYEDLGTGGSGSMEDGWAMLRQAGAAARAMLVTAAAKQWNISPNECHTERGAVVHPAKGRLEFGALVSDAAKLQVPKEAKPKARSDYKIIGRPTARIDGRDVVTGRAQYGIDTKIPGMLYASVERPPFTGAKAEKMDEEKARAVRGVHSILRGDFGIAVVAENSWAAIKGRTALAVKWSDPPPDAFDSEAHAKKLESAAREKGNLTRHEVAPNDINPAARTIEAIYSYPFYAHAPVETMNCVAHVEGEHCTLWVPTQAPNRVQKRVAESLGTTPDKVEVNVTLMGGGFGRRLAADYAIEAAAISRAAKAAGASALVAPGRHEARAFPGCLGALSRRRFGFVRQSRFLETDQGRLVSQPLRARA